LVMMDGTLLVVILGSNNLRSSIEGEIDFSFQSDLKIEMSQNN